MEVIKNKDIIKMMMFGKEKELKVFSTGDNYEENYKEEKFDLNKQELDCLEWFIKNVKIEDYIKEIVDYCNDKYWLWSDKKINESDVEKEIDIYAIAINVTKIWKSNDGFIYPEISFYGNCNCDEDHGICIGFRDKKFLGISSQDWTL